MKIMLFKQILVFFLVTLLHINIVLAENGEVQTDAYIDSIGSRYLTDSGDLKPSVLNLKINRSEISDSIEEESVLKERIKIIDVNTVYSRKFLSLTQHYPPTVDQTEGLLDKKIYRITDNIYYKVGDAVFDLVKIYSNSSTQ